MQRSGTTLDEAVSTQSTTAGKTRPPCRRWAPGTARRRATARRASGSRSALNTPWFIGTSAKTAFRWRPARPTPCTRIGPLMAPFACGAGRARSRASRGRPRSSGRAHPERRRRCRRPGRGRSSPTHCQVPSGRFAKCVAQQLLGVVDELVHRRQHDVSRAVALARAPAAGARSGGRRRSAPAGRRTSPVGDADVAQDACRTSSPSNTPRATSFIGGMISPSPCELRALGSNVPGHVRRRCPSSARCSG